MNKDAVKEITSDKEAFDFIKNHLLKQNEKAENDSGCLYATHLRETKREVHSQALEQIKDILGSDRIDFYDIEIAILEQTDYNSFCAIGCLFSIDKNFLRTEVGLLEGEMVRQGSAVVESIAKLHPKWFITDNSVKMLKSLQFIHDFKDPVEWDNIISSIEKCFTNSNFPEFIARNIVWTEYGDQIDNYINR